MSIVNKSVIACVLLAGLVSCEKHGGVYKGGPEVGDLKDLVVPADFDWKTSDDIECQVSASAPARVQVYRDAELTSKAADLYVKPGIDPVKLVIPRGVNEVYMRYMDRNEAYQVQTVAVANGKINFELPEGSRNFSPTPVKSKSKNPDYSSVEAEGTLLFEDNYPNKGDYDFNDYVITYDIEAEHDDDDNNNKKLLGLDVEIEFVAKGGYLSYEPYLCLKGVKYQLLDTIEMDEGTPAGIRVEPIKHLGNDNDLILRFTGIEEAMLRQMQGQKRGAINTIKEEETKNFVELEFDIKFKGNVLNKFEGGDIYDFFLGGDINGRFTEIHAREFSSTRLVTDNSVEAGKYCTSDNFVWVLKIPENHYDSKQTGKYKVFPYLNEKVDFLKGYPKFKGYVEASGGGNYDWCHKNNRNDEHLIFFEKKKGEEDDD